MEKSDSAKQEDPKLAHECYICYEPLDGKKPIQYTPCIHGFHLECIETWIRGKVATQAFNQTLECPVCKFNINELAASLLNIIPDEQNDIEYSPDDIQATQILFPMLPGLAAIIRATQNPNYRSSGMINPSRMSESDLADLQQADPQPTFFQQYTALHYNPNIQINPSLRHSYYNALGRPDPMADGLSSESLPTELLASTFNEEAGNPVPPASQSNPPIPQPTTVADRIVSRAQRAQALDDIHSRNASDRSRRMVSNIVGASLPANPVPQPNPVQPTQYSRDAALSRYLSQFAGSNDRSLRHATAQILGSWSGSAMPIREEINDVVRRHMSESKVGSGSTQRLAENLMRPTESHPTEAQLREARLAAITRRMRRTVDSNPALQPIAESAGNPVSQPNPQPNDINDLD